MVYGLNEVKKEKRRPIMTKKMVVMALVITLVGAGMAYAVSTDTFKITFTPSGTRGVLIDTTTVALGSIQPGNSVNTGAIPTESTGTVGVTEYRLSATVLSGGSSLATTLSPAASEVLVRALFDDTVPADVDYDDVNHIVDGTPKGAGNAGNNVSYENDNTNANMDSMDLNTLRDLYCRVTLPSSVNYSGLQEVEITVDAQAQD